MNFVYSYQQYKNAFILIKKEKKKEKSNQFKMKQ